MTIATEEFFSTFHSLNGTTIGERRKNLFLLLNKIQDPQSIDLTAIQPKSRLEESFKVETLIYFKRVPDLVEVLKSENPILIEKILKASSWFLQQALESISGEDLVKHIFPSLSFNAKVKLLNKLACHLKNTEQADAIFNAVKEKYGYYLAAKLLPCCSGDIIMACIRLSRIELTPRQLTMIVETHPRLTESILLALTEYQGKAAIQSKYANIFKHVLKNDVLLFLKLRREFQPSFSLGWRATDRLVVGNKQDVIKNADLLYKLLHKKQMIKSVSLDFNEFYMHLLPTSLGRFKEDYNFYLELIPSKMVHKIDVLLTTFREKYGDDLWDDPDCVTPGLLELMTPDEREAWMQTHERPKGLAEDMWLCLMKAEKAIPALKKRISSISNVKERAELAGCLVETCRINNDKVALLEVCKYVLMQHRNDDSAVVLCFLKTLKNCFCLDTLEDEHWKCINEMVQLFILREMIPYHYNDWLLAYIHYRLAKNLPVNKELKDVASKTYAGNLCTIPFYKSQYQKRYLLKFGEIVPEIFASEDSETYRLQFLSTILRWNKKHRNDQISLLPYKYLLTKPLDVMKTKEYAYSYMLDGVLWDYISTRIDGSEKIAILDVYLGRKNVGITMDAMEWLIKYEPWIILRYIDSIINHILDLWYTLIKPFFWKQCRNYAHLQLPQKIISICLGVINNKEASDSRKKNAITALSYLMPPEEFLSLIAPFYPSDLVMDVNSEENQETYKIQQAITACLKNVIPPSCSLQSVAYFSKGDYLKFIQRSLSSVSHSVAEEKLPVLFASLTDRAVSVRKHTIYLTFKVMDKVEIYKMLTKFMESEKNSSIRKFLFKGTFSYFSKNPDDYLWGLVKQNVKAVDINDEEAFKTLMDIKKVPSVYLGQYLIFTWELLETLPNSQKFEDGKCKLLDAVSSTVIPNLNRDFCLKIIKKYLFKSRELTTFQNKIYSFTCKFVVYSLGGSEQEERLETIFAILKEYVNTTWYKSGTKTMGRILIFGFLKEFCSFFTEKICLVRNILIKFIELWNGFLKPHDAFEEYLHLQFTLIYVDYVNDKLSLVQVGQRFSKLCDSILGVYGNAVANKFCGSLHSHICSFLDDTDDSLERSRFALIESIISASNSTNCFIMAVSLLPQDVPATPKLKVVYNRIMSMLEKNSDVVVQLSLSYYFGGIASRTSIDIPAGKHKRKEHGGYGRCFRTVREYDSKYKK